jgi:aspartyl-tRNA(Asn)/glutamyl-tRNA(Gln) amidotransferase subunit B
VNRSAVEHILRVGTAIGGTLADESVFDRKSYFYPDIPKGYQISQYEHPLVSGGTLAGVQITRVHLEEDTARSTHTKKGSLVDFNRAGIPLMELVTEPVIHDAESAGRFARELQLLLRTLQVGEANLEKGQMRIEANISISNDPKKLGTKVEVKNLNSFRSVERAIAFELARQEKALTEGREVIQETRGWNEALQETFHQRIKEGGADYRYFPEPDLPRIFTSEIEAFAQNTLRASLPELPWERLARYQTAYDLKESDASYLTATNERAACFDAIVEALNNKKSLAQLAANYLISDVAGIYAKKGRETYELMDPVSFAKLVQLLEAGTLSSRGAKDVLAVLIETGQDPEAIATERGLIQINDEGALAQTVQTVLQEEQKAVEEYQAGKEAALQYLLGKSMKAMRGAGNPEALRKILIQELKK